MERLGSVWRAGVMEVREPADGAVISLLVKSSRALLPDTALITTQRWLTCWRWDSNCCLIESRGNKVRRGEGGNKWETIPGHGTSFPNVPFSILAIPEVLLFEFWNSHFTETDWQRGQSSGGFSNKGHRKVISVLSPEYRVGFHFYPGAAVASSGSVCWVRVVINNREGQTARCFSDSSLMERVV